MPTSLPTLQPSSQPSDAPSTVPSYDPCRGFYGTYGDTTTSYGTTVSFEYGVESDTSVNSLLSDQVRGVESKMLESLIEGIFSECTATQPAVPTTRRFLDSGGNANETMTEYSHDSVPRQSVTEWKVIESKDLKSLHIEVGEDSKNLLHQHKDIPAVTSVPILEQSPSVNIRMLNNENEDSAITGISSSPVDLASGKKCPTGTSGSSDCNVIEGRLTLYLSDQTHAANATSATIQLIKTIIDDGLLDNSHPAILNVTFMPDARLELRTPSDEDTDDLSETDTIAPIRNIYIWIAAAGGLVAVSALWTAARYRYVSARQREGRQTPGIEQDESNSNFVEVGSAHLRDDDDNC